MDFKLVNHVQQIEVLLTEDTLLLRERCFPEMKKDHVYKLLISMNCRNCDIVSAACGCPGGKGPELLC